MNATSRYVVAPRACIDCKRPHRRSTKRCSPCHERAVGLTPCCAPPKPCKKCGQMFTPATPHRRACDACRNPACADCGKPRPYGHGHGRCAACAGKYKARKPRGEEGQVILPTRKPVPTDARPGTPERVLVLAARYEAGEHLFHPEDAK